MGRYLKTGYLRELEYRLSKGEISYSNMIELIEIETIRNWRIQNHPLKRIRRFFNEIHRGFKIAEQNRHKSQWGKW
jgi:hypothetical protein